MKRFQHQVLAIATLALGLLLAAPLHAGTYSKVDQSTWWAGVSGLPTYVNMYSYVPSTVASKPPIVVYCHHCQGDAASSHGSMAGLEKLADTNGFLIIYPEATGENCWDAGSVRSLKHGGGGDAGAVVQMVKYYISKYSGDAGRVYLSGDSSGGIMTEALLGVYPDVFMAGISIMGVPCGCWGDGYNDVTGKPSSGTGQWSGTCAGGTVTKTGAQWGDLVRSYFPGYTGHRPRLQQWHGATDTTLNFKNVAEDIKEWTNLLALSETPSGTEQNTPKSGTTHQYWKNSCYTVYETFVLAGVGHAVSLDGATLAAYFGIDKAGGQDPETVACPGAVPGGDGTGGAGGSPGSGGATGAGGTTAGDGGLGGRDGGSREVGAPGSGGAQASGGVSGAQGTGGATGNGGAQATGGISSGGGSTSKGGTTGGGVGGGSGSGGNGGAGDAGGSPATGGKAGSGGSSVKTSTGGDGGANGQGGNSGNGGDGYNSSGGCICAVGSHGGHAASQVATLLLAAAFGLSIRRKRRSPR
jgi:poly(hydroxyalkanoate) depolymerase family esterase